MIGGIFPTNAPVVANITLTAELGMGGALIIGRWLARRGQYRLHAWCQSSIVLLNLVVIAFAMAPAFHEQVLPKIPAKLGRSFFAVAMVHALLGIIAEALALYVLLAAGTKLLPLRFRLQNYKKTMRIVLGIWWLALVLGVATYARWYVRL